MGHTKFDKEKAVEAVIMICSGLISFFVVLGCLERMSYLPNNMGFCVKGLRESLLIFFLFLTLSFTAGIIWEVKSTPEKEKKSYIKLFFILICPLCLLFAMTVYLNSRDWFIMTDTGISWNKASLIPKYRNNVSLTWEEIDAIKVTGGHRLPGSIEIYHEVEGEYEELASLGLDGKFPSKDQMFKVARYLARKQAHKEIKRL